MYRCEHCGTELYLLDTFIDNVYKCRKCRREYDEDYLEDNDINEEE